jgi:hypothetical protein
MSEDRSAGGPAGRSPIGLAIAVLVPICLLCASADALPTHLRLWASFLLIAVLPGAGLAFCGGCRGLNQWEKAAAAFVGSLVVLVAVGLVCNAADWGLGAFVWIVPTAGVVISLAGWRYGPRRGETAGEEYATRRFHILAAAVVLVSLLGGLGLSGEMGAATDAYDHLATVREIRDNGELFPLSAFYKYPEAPLPDPRKGLFHAGLAAMCHYCGEDPETVWIWLPKALLPLTLLIVFCLGRTLTGTSPGGVLCAVLWVLCFGGPGSRLLVQLGYAHNVSEIASWVLILLLLKHVSGGRARLVAFSAVGLAATCFVHISAIVLALAAWGCFLLAVLLTAPARKAYAGRLAGAGVIWLILGVPAATVKLLMSYAPANPIQLQSQNLLYLTDSLYTVNPMWVYSWLGTPGALAVIFGVWLAVRRGKTPGTLYMAGAALVPVLIVLNPLLVPLGYSVIGYIVERLTWVVPYPYILAFGLLEFDRRIRARGHFLLRAGAAVLALLVTHAVLTAAHSRYNKLRSNAVSYADWRPAIEFLRENVADESVVASDMLTSYSVPAFTKHHIVSTLHQHGSPNDPKGVDRIVALVQIMDPDVAPQILKRRLMEYEVDYVLVNSSFDRRRRLYFTEIDPASFARHDSSLSRRGYIFSEVFRAGGLSLFAVDREALDSWSPGPGAPAPYFLADGAKPAGRRINEVFDGQVKLLSVTLQEDPVQKDEGMEITCYWQGAVERLTFDLPWVVQVRLQREYPKGRFYSESYSKVYRKILGALTGENYRWRASHLPAGGAVPPSVWGNSVVVDRAVVPLPGWLKPGAYDVTVSIGQEPVYPIFRLGDYLRDDDRYSGVVVGSVEVE